MGGFPLAPAAPCYGLPMPVDGESTRGARRVAAIALLVLVVAWVAAPLLELARGERYADADDPAVSLEFFQASGQAVVLAGIAICLAAATLVVAAAAFEVLLARSSRGGVTTPGIRATAVAAYLAAGLLLLAGALRISGPGTLGYIAGLDVEWARSGYLAMHLVGTQGAIAGARLAVAVWMLAVMILAVRRQLLPAWTLVLTPIPVVLAAAVVGPLLGPLLDPGSEIAWLLLMFAFLVGVPIWCAVVAACLGFGGRAAGGTEEQPAERAATG